jgi:hypothetical protein
MRLTSTGLGIGTSSISNRLTVRGAVTTKTTAIRWERGEDGLVAGGLGYYYDSENSLAIGAVTNHPLKFIVNDTTRATIDTSGNLGLGVVPSAWSAYKAIQTTGASFIGYSDGASNNQAMVVANAFYDSGANWKYIYTDNASRYQQLDGQHIWYNAASGTANTNISFTQAMTLDASGNLLVGTTTSPSGAGNIALGSNVLRPNTGYLLIEPKYPSPTAGYYFYDTTSGFFSLPDNTNPLGNASYRWTTVYATTALINTSDVNTKQQIRSLNDAEKAVAQSIKGLIKAYKFNDSVAEKGDGARIHVGVIAQDVQAAFTAQGLDSNKYSMFCSDTWYEVDGKARSEKDGFYTKDTPNAVEVTRLGIRYDELLAFVISTL